MGLGWCCDVVRYLLLAWFGPVWYVMCCLFCGVCFDVLVRVIVVAFVLFRYGLFVVVSFSFVLLVWFVLLCLCSVRLRYGMLCAVLCDV